MIDSWQDDCGERGEANIKKRGPEPQILQAAEVSREGKGGEEKVRWNRGRRKRKWGCVGRGAGERGRGEEEGAG